MDYDRFYHNNDSKQTANEPVNPSELPVTKISSTVPSENDKSADETNDLPTPNIKEDKISKDQHVTARDVSSEHNSELTERNNDGENNRIKKVSTSGYTLDFTNVNKEVEAMTSKVIQIDHEKLGRILSKYVALGSLITKSTPDDLKIAANLKGLYPNKEEKNVHKNSSECNKRTIGK